MKEVLTLAILDQVKSIASDTFAVPIDALAADSSPASIEAWDSIQHLTLVLALEQQFGLHFSPEEIEEMVSLGRIGAMVESRVKRR